MPAEPRPGKLLTLAVEGVVPVMAGCAGALAGGPEGGMVGGMIGIAVGQSVEKVINFFGGQIVQRWAEWFRQQSPADRDKALTELAGTTPEEARRQAEELLDALVLEPLPAEDRELAVSYLSLLPASLDRALIRPAPGGERSLPPTISPEEPQQLLALLPMTLPPYPVGCEVPGTPYRLEALLGTGGFGAVYRASTRSLQHLPLAVKFCLDSGLAQALHRERDNLERLMKAGGEDWSPRIVRLYGYDLEHKTPYLVYEFVTGGDLIRYLGARREKSGRALDAHEVFAIIQQVTEALAFAHDNGLVHRDLKPANVLVEGGVVKLADFGLGGISAARAAQTSRIGATTVDLLSLADQASLFRGAGTPLYMAPEQRRGLPPDPRHDLFSLGVMWYQLLIGDVSRELHPGWAKELSLRYNVPRSHINFIDACVGWFDERPKNAGELLRLMQEMPRETEAASAKSEVPPTPALSALPVASLDEMRQSLLVNMIKKVVQAHRDTFTIQEKKSSIITPAAIVAFIVYCAASTERLTVGTALIMAIVLSGLAAGVSALILLGRQREARERLQALITTLEREFPAIVAGWGGTTVLHDANLVEQIARKMGIDIDPQQVKPETSLPVLRDTLDPLRRAAAVEHLHELRQEQVRLHGYGPRKPVPWPVAVIFGIVVGTAAGIGMGFYIHTLLAPQGISQNAGEPLLWYSLTGKGLSQSEIVQARRTANVAGPLGGLGVALLVASLITWFLARRSWHRWQLLVGLALGLVVAVPVGIGVGALVKHLNIPFQTVSNRGNWEYYLASGQSTSWMHYYLKSSVVSANAVLCGVNAGVVVLLAILFALQWWYRQRARAAELAVEEQARRTAEAFPELAAAGGGVEGLSRPGSARQLLLGLGEQVTG